MKDPPVNDILKVFTNLGLRYSEAHSDELCEELWVGCMCDQDHRYVGAR
jgi:hypothetical protein